MAILVDLNQIFSSIYLFVFHFPVILCRFFSSILQLNFDYFSILDRNKTPFKFLTLFVKVPATIITSACLGEALKTTPYLSMSYRGAAMCIISTAQQAKPKVKGHREFLRPQLAKSSILARA